MSEQSSTAPGATEPQQSDVSHVVGLIPAVLYLFYAIHMMPKPVLDNSLEISIIAAVLRSEGGQGALLDAIKCVGDPHDPSQYTSKSLGDRMKHTEWINAEINKIIAKNMRQHCWLGYCGPWIEDTWMDMSKEAFETFGPFVPLFVPWVRMWTTHNYVYTRWRDQIFALFSKEYFYITVSFNDDGVEGLNENHEVLPKNLIVISGGGKGHIPALIFLGEHNPRDFPVSEHYEYDAMFAGSMTHSSRQFMIDEFQRRLGNKFVYHKKVEWKTEYEKAKFICSPRGYGRNSFRLTEVLQSGRVPIYVYNDIIWLPYYDSIDWASFSIVVHYSKLNEAVERINRTSDSDIVQMRRKIASLYDSHFTSKAVFSHIRQFMLHGFAKSDLRCANYSYSRN